jgi:hypothetical protein
MLAYPQFLFYQTDVHNNFKVNNIVLHSIMAKTSRHKHKFSDYLRKNLIKLWMGNKRFFIVTLQKTVCETIGKNICKAHGTKWEKISF